ncbi:hypothetical protein H9N25_10630 [Pedobacter riviphilus]|uniref:CHRD domain-containing protein n=1 Tax=Pedobacter riviphilus TaxID=2766984 RepID=A0ABX6TPG0_9SPHI|nr:MULTISPECIES: hypothetical protein [Pedobacter]NII83213.1 hypothetical protein [Pedobacter sp. SG908]QNR86800.1 hypothetical protein H9N25_10630 [Pedobacter riviphilus]
MKTPIKINHIAAIGMICLTVISTSACKKTTLQKPNSSRSKEVTYRVSSVMDASMTKSGSKASGDLSGAYAANSKKLVFVLNFKEIDPTLIEFRNEKNAVVGTIKKPKANYVSPVKGEVILGTVDPVSLMGQKISVHLISTQFPKGEISGHLSVKNSN